jgi:hypothetical protein
VVEQHPDVFLNVIGFPYLAQQNIQLVILVGQKLFTHRSTRRNNSKFLFIDIVSFKSWHFVFRPCIVWQASDCGIIFNAK